MLAQVLGHGAAVFAVARHAQVQGFEAAQGQEAVLRARRAAAGVLVEAQALQQLIAVEDQRAHHHVGVAGHVLGERVHHNVGPQRQRLLQVGGRERVIHGQQRAGRFGDGRHARDVNDVEQRVGGRFDPDELGIGRDFGLHRRQVAHRHEVALDAQRRVHLGHDAVGAAVEVVGRDDLIAGFQQAQHAVDGRHAGGEGQAVLAIIQRRQGVLELGAGGVVGARVLVALVVARRALGVGRGLVDGRHDGPGFGVRVHAGVDGFGGKFHKTTKVPAGGGSGGRHDFFGALVPRPAPILSWANNHLPSTYYMKKNATFFAFAGFSRRPGAGRPASPPPPCPTRWPASKPWWIPSTAPFTTSRAASYCPAASAS